MDEITTDTIRDAQQGDKTAFHNIVESYSSRIYSIAYQIVGNSPDARDILQDVFIRLYQSLEKYDAQYKFSSWLYRMTVNVSIDYRRRNSRRRIVSLWGILDQSVFKDDTSHIEEQTEHNELKGAIHKLIKVLSVQQQKVFVLRDLQGFATAEVAEILHCSQATVRVHLAHARQKIRDALIKYYPELCSLQS